MTVLTFSVTFHSPFRVGGAYARDGVAATVDPGNALPADHLKGVMRAAAAQLLGNADHPAIGQVFGHPATPSPWSWSNAVPSDHQVWQVTTRHRVQIEETTHSARKDHLVQAEQAWAPTARFTVTRVGPIQHDTQPDTQPGSQLTEAAHKALLRCAAAGVHGLGGWRRRGLGWVGITPDDGPVTAEDVTVIRAIAEQTRQATR